MNAAIGYKEEETTRASLELLYHISRELAAAIDLSTVLQRVLFLSIRYIGAASASMIVLDDEGGPVDSAIIIGKRIIEHTTQDLQATLEHGLAGWVARQKQAVLIPDTSRDERWLRRPDDAVDKTGPKSAVGVPLLVRDRLVGVMTLVHPTPGFFTPDHLALIQAIADQASIAVFNARLYNESQRQARVMQAIAESAAVITGTLELEDVLQRIMEQISQALRVEFVSLALVDNRGNSLKFLASTDKTAHSVIGLQLNIGEGIAGWVAREGQGVIVTDPHTDPRFYSGFDQRTGFETHAIACAPISLRGVVIGVLEAINPLNGFFEPDALQVLTGIGGLAGTAIHHAQLFEQLQAAHQRYLELFEESIETIIITDLHGNILEANHQAQLFTHLDRGTLVKMSIAQVHDIDHEKVGKNFENLTSGGMLSYESTLSTQDDRRIPVQVYVRNRIIDGTDYLQWIIQDISERKNLDILREDLISMIYHDLRSPLGNIISSLDVFDAMLPPDGDPSFRSLLNIALRSTERIQRLTNSLLDINRLESGQSVGNPFPTSPLLLAKDAIDAVQPVAATKNQSIRLILPSDLPNILVEADMIRRVLINLVENAVKYTPPGGEISVGAQVAGEWVQIWVLDNGPGIPEPEQDRIFEKFTRLNIKDGPKGIGLGLSYCRLAIESHGGRIWMENQPGQGARFCFTLPAVSR